MSNWDYANEVPTEIWKSAMSLPRELKFIRENDELKLLQQPIKEIKQLRNKKYEFENIKINKKKNKLFKEINSPLEISSIINLDNKTDFEFSFEFKKNELSLKYNSEKNKIILNRKNAASDFHPDFREEQTVEIDELNKLKLQILIDWSSIEIFINDGRWVITDLIFPEDEILDLKINNLAEILKIDKLDIFELDSIW